MPKWLDDAVFYEIYPQSFKDSNADGIGDFKGIEEKLDYVKELGCSAIWLNPCWKSPFKDAGYDVSDYYRTAERYGSNEDLKHLIETAHSKGVRILLDLVAGHTSIEHPWFQESMKPEKNEYTDRYIWSDNIWKDPVGCSPLRGISDRNGTAGCNFYSIQPALNYGYYKPDPEEPWQQSMEDEGPKATLEALKEVMRFWLDLGADGFRIDMAHSLVKNDPDSLGTIALWQKIRKFLDEEYPEAAIVSEWGEPDKSLAGGFHMDFLLHFGPSHYIDLFHQENPYFGAQSTGDAASFVEKYEKTRALAGKEGLICIPSGNHDMIRMTDFINEEEAKRVFGFVLTVPGVPFIYYGDEIAMNYQHIPSKEGGFERTGSRTPMQWTPGVNAGFSSAPQKDLYLPVDPDSKGNDVLSQKKNPDSLYHTVTDLIRLRKENPALANRSDMEFVMDGKDHKPLAYIRSTVPDEKDGSIAQRILVCINPADKAQDVHFEYPLKEMLYMQNEAPDLLEKTIRMKPQSMVLFEF